MFVVTGTPRSATGYMSLIFKALNVCCTHERVFRPTASIHEVMDWYVEGGRKGESSWLAWAFLGVFPGSPPLLHVVRDPWKVVDSLVYRNDIVPREAKLDRGKRAYRDLVQWYVPEMLEHEGNLDRAAVFVVRWNQLIEDAAKGSGCPYLRFQVEDLTPTLLQGIAGHVSVPCLASEAEQALETVPRNVNAGKRVEYNVKIVHPEIRDAIKKTHPEQEPIIGRFLYQDTPRDRMELAAEMDGRLAQSLDALAEQYGYSRKAQHEEISNGTHRFRKAV